MKESSVARPPWGDQIRGDKIIDLKEPLHWFRHQTELHHLTIWKHGAKQNHRGHRIPSLLQGWLLAILTENGLMGLMNVNWQTLIYDTWQKLFLSSCSQGQNPFKTDEFIDSESSFKLDLSSRPGTAILPPVSLILTVIVILNGWRIPRT